MAGTTNQTMRKTRTPARYVHANFRFSGARHTHVKQEEEVEEDEPPPVHTGPAILPPEPKLLRLQADHETTPLTTAWASWRDTWSRRHPHPWLKRAPSLRWQLQLLRPSSRRDCASPQSSLAASAASGLFCPRPQTLTKHLPRYSSQIGD